jgi:hypothetical protein
VAQGVTLYGTTGEGTRLGMTERAAMLNTAKDSGMPCFASFNPDPSPGFRVKSKLHLI